MIEGDSIERVSSKRSLDPWRCNHSCTSCVNTVYCEQSDDLLLLFLEEVGRGLRQLWNEVFLVLRFTFEFFLLELGTPRALGEVLALQEVRPS